MSTVATFCVIASQNKKTKNKTCTTASRQQRNQHLLLIGHDMHQSTYIIWRGTFEWIGELGRENMTFEHHVFLLLLSHYDHLSVGLHTHAWVVIRPRFTRFRISFWKTALNATPVSSFACMGGNDWVDGWIGPCECGFWKHILFAGFWVVDQQGLCQKLIDETLLLRVFHYSYASSSLIAMIIPCVLSHAL